ncbi:M14 family zinc carboxypeptidase [Aliiglaciecola sp. M165]|uniref:M14 family zinc carboxypeptidase n=1 Tax=Aliiglaciecola sp. M165 TaxID=2593649 RepID=UPI0011816A05|nr:M14 family zinc carboxypeptidase [Aliiglaciecola sp. M165]TRY32388.1 hypothetical protein FM019_05965 [Aliiglaciecola sp. M165]
MFPDHQYLYEMYQADKIENIDKIHLKPVDIEEPLNHLFTPLPALEAEVIGYSYLGQAIRKFVWGDGPLCVLCWSQMHGDESTATAAIIDVLNTLCSRYDDKSILALKETLTIHFVPMINPDGAMKIQRENAQGIDINRDARALQSPEGKTLKGLIDILKPSLCFNLHDQNRYYRIANSQQPTTLAFLVPEGDEAGTLTENRLYAISLLDSVIGDLQEFMNGGIAKYSDTYSPRAFGDYASSVGVPCILIESGEYITDPNRQQARWLNYLVLMKMFHLLATNSQERSAPHYKNLPDNIENGMSDLLIRNVTVHRTDIDYMLDMSLRIEGNKGYIYELGDLQQQGGFEQFDANGAMYLTGMTFEVTQPLDLTDAAYINLLKQGYCRFGGDISQINNLSSWPIVKGLGFNEPAKFWSEGLPPTCLFKQDDYIVAVLLKGNLIVLD